jgi:hypothetical protein
MEETWTSRDLPVLEAVITLLDESPQRLLRGGAVVQETGIEPAKVLSALHALNPEYIQLGGGAAAGRADMQIIKAVTAAGRRAAGQWPTGESLIEQLAAGLTAAAERESDPEQKTRLQRVAGDLAGAAKYIAIDIARQLLEHQIPGAH